MRQTTSFPRSATLTSLALLLAATLTACAADGGDGDDDDQTGATPTSLEIQPGDATLTVKNGVAATQGYTAIAHYADGRTADVTAETFFGVDTALIATFTGAELTASGVMAGITGVRGTYKGVAGAGKLTVRVEQARVEASAPANAPDLFAAAGEDPARAPTPVYPADQTLVPPNLGTFDVQWVDGTGNDLWEVSITSAVLDLRVYTGASNPADFVTFSSAEWKLVSDSHRSDSVKIVIRGLASANPQQAGSASPLALAFTRDDLQGGIYYWAASAAGIYRHDFGKPDEAAEEFYGSTFLNKRCVACHALSRDGTKMIVTFDGGGGAASVIDVKTRQPLFATDGSVVKSNFSVFSPDASTFLATSGGVITWRDTATGALLQTVNTGGPATHPDWSPKNDRIVWVGYGQGSDWANSGAGALYTQTFDDAQGTFGPPVLLVAAPGGPARNYYPTFSPDGQWVLYNVSDADFYNDMNAQMWVVRADGAQPPILLATSDVGAGLTNSWARWAPFEQETGGEHSEPVFWFTVSSKRPYGVRLPNPMPAPNTPENQDGRRPQIWMAPFYPNRAAAGQDPTKPMFWLPFQDINTSNHIAQWTEVVVPVD